MGLGKLPVEFGKTFGGSHVDPAAAVSFAGDDRARNSVIDQRAQLERAPGVTVAKNSGQKTPMPA
jgi:hypothetical protein